MLYGRFLGGLGAGFEKVRVQFGRGHAPLFLIPAFTLLFCLVIAAKFELLLLLRLH